MKRETRGSPDSKSETSTESRDLSPVEYSKKLRAVVSDSPLMIFVVDSQGRFLLAEGRAIALWNTNTENILGSSVSQVCKAVPELQALIESALKGRPALQSISFSSRLFEIGLLPILGDNGDVELVHGYGIDITDRRQSQDAYSQQQRFFKQVIDINPNFIFAKNRAGEFVLVNQAVADAYGTTVEDLLGRTDADFNANLDEVEHFRQDDIGVIDSGEETFIPEEVITDADGNLRYLQTMKRAVLDSNGNPQFVLGVSTDITERKATERALEARLKFEQLISSISTNFINLAAQEIDSGINEALKKIGLFVEADRCSVVMLRPDARSAEVSHEWCASGIPSLLDRLGKLESEPYPWFVSIISEAKPVLIEDVAKLSADAQPEKNFLNQLAVKSLLCIPMIYQKRLVGFLAVQTLEQAAEWSSDVVSMLKLMSEIIVSAVERQRAAFEQARNLERTEKLRFVAEKLNLADNLDDVYETSIEAIINTLGVDRASLLLIDEDDQLRHKASYGLSYSYTQRVSPYSPWPLDDINAQPVVLNDVSRSALEPWLKESIRREGFSACAFFPLIGKDRLIGRLMAYVDEPHVFTPEKVNIGRVLSTNISTAIRRVLSKAALEESEELYRQFFEEDLTGDYIANSDGSIVRCNEAFARIFGFETVEQAMQQNMTALYGDELFRQQFLKEVRRHGVLYMHEMELQRVDGRPVHIIENVRGVFSPEGELVQTRGYVFDITERKIAEQRIREHAALLDNTQDAIIVRDLDDRVLFWNRAAEMLYGWTSREALGRTLTSLLPPHSPEYTDEALRMLLLEGKWRGEVEQTTKDGDEIVVESRCTVVRDDRGRPKSILVVNSNITDRRKWEAERLKASKLESVGLLAGGIAHDFNNILTAIVGNISLAKVETESNEAAYMRLLRAEKAANRAKDLTQQLLTFAKGGAPIKKAASVAAIVRDTVEFASRGAKSAVSLSVPENLWPAELDQGQISQVIHNLIINANQAMAEGGTIFVTCENFVNDPNSTTGIGSLPFGRYVRIHIKDEGKGIAESDLPKIFDPYFSTKEGGSGLGLATTYSIVKKHQGQIFVDSDINRGTRFDILLPANPSLALDGAPRRKELVRGKGESVLVMDDDETVRDIVGNMLVELGYEPSFARDGSEALELYSFSLSQGRTFSVVLMDLTIPGGLGGKDTVRELLKIDPNAVAIVSSGYSNDPIMANYEKFGFRGVAAKPFRLHDLAEAIAAALEAQKTAGGGQATA